MQNKNFGALGRPCKHHSDSFIIGVCTYSDCMNRSLCAKCQENHDSKHKGYMKSLVEVLMLDAEFHINEAIATSNSFKTDFDAELERVDKFFEKLKIQIEESLNVLKNDIISKFVAKNQIFVNYAKDLDIWESLKQNFEKKREEALIYKNDDLKTIEELRIDFFDSYSSIECKKKELENLKQSFKQIVLPEEKLSQVSFKDEIWTLLTSEPISVRGNPPAEEESKDTMTTPSKVLVKANEISYLMRKKSPEKSAVKTPTRRRTEPILILEKKWSWDQSRKSKKLKISSDNLTVEKIGPGSDKRSAVIGDTLFDSGKWRWSIDVTTSNAEASWICFGIIRSTSIKDLENLNQYETIGISTTAGIYQMVKLNDLSNYDKKIYTLDLDLDRYVFTIHCEDKPVFETKNIHKGSMFYPFCILKYPENKVKLIWY